MSNINFPSVANGVQLKIWQCFDGLPQQNWNHPNLNTLGDAGTIALSVDNKCVYVCVVVVPPITCNL